MDKKDDQKPLIFISYAREDIVEAVRLSEVLKLAGFDTWIDQERLLPGQYWPIEIRKAIKSCDYFIALLSLNSVPKRGFVQRELKQALDVIEELPEYEKYLIPVRLHDCDTNYEILQRIHWVDLFPHWEVGVNKLVFLLRQRPWKFYHQEFDCNVVSSFGEIRFQSSVADQLQNSHFSDRDLVNKIVEKFFCDGDISPLLSLVERKLLPVLSNRDHGGMREFALKTLLLGFLFDDRRYVLFSELEAAHGYADLCLLRRPSLFIPELFNFIFEFKYIPLKATGLTSAELWKLDREKLCSMKSVRKSLDTADAQLERYRRGFCDRFGLEETARLRCYAIVIVGFERVVGQEAERFIKI